MTEPTSLDVLGRLLPSLALIVGVLLLARRWAQRRGPLRTGGGVRVLTRAGLTRGAVLAVVAVGRRRFLVGATDQAVSLLGELADGDLQLELDGEPGSLDAGRPLAAAGGDLRSTRAMERRASYDDRPRMGLVDRLRAMTVRTHLDRPVRVPHR